MDPDKVDETNADDAAITKSPLRVGFLAGAITVPGDFDRMGEVEIEAKFSGSEAPSRPIPPSS